MINVSFSWDDGSVFDIKLAELMLKHNIMATFFIPTTNLEQAFIKQQEIKEIYNMDMQIGGHTVSHKYLIDIPKKDIENEIRDNKLYLEDIIEENIDIFCYPGGFYNEYIENITKQYYKRARSAKTMRFNIQRSFTIDTTFHFYNRGIKSIFKNTLQNDKKEIFTISKYFLFDTFNYYKNILLNLNNNKDYNIHIWGHGWEIEKHNLWYKLKEFLKFLQDNNFQIKNMYEMYL